MTRRALSFTKAGWYPNGDLTSEAGNHTVKVTTTLHLSRITAAS